MVAPGAEEFLATDTPGPVAAAGADVRAARRTGDRRTVQRRARALSSTSMIEHEFDDAYVARRPPLLPGRRRSAGHALRPEPAGRAATRPATTTSRAPARVDADGWAFRLSSAVEQASQAARSTTASPARTGWSRGDIGDIAQPGRRRRFARQTEDLHDVTTSLETDIPETATRVFVLYKINTGYTRVDTDAQRGPASTPASTCRSTRRCRSTSRARSGKCWSGFGTCSAIPTTRRRSTTSSSSSAAEARGRRLPGPLLAARSVYVRYGPDASSPVVPACPSYVATFSLPDFGSPSSWLETSSIGS